MSHAPNQGNWTSRSGWFNKALKLGRLVKAGKMGQARIYGEQLAGQAETSSQWNQWCHRVADLLAERKNDEAILDVELSVVA